MMKLYLCEDDAQQREHLKKTIDNVVLIENLDMEFSCVTDNPYTLLEKVADDDCIGLYFLDIDLKTDMTGLTLAKEIRKYDPRGFIVFVTTHSEMSYMTFMYKLEALDFILKDDVEEMTRRVHECILKANERFSSANNKTKANYSLVVGDKIITVDYDEILFFETSVNAHKVILHCKSRQLEFPGKIKEIERELDDRFYRCHRSFLVNTENILEVNTTNGTIRMVNGDECLLSFRQIKGLKDRLKLKLNQ